MFIIFISCSFSLKKLRGIDYLQSRKKEQKRRQIGKKL